MTDNKINPFHTIKVFSSGKAKDNVQGAVSLSSGNLGAESNATSTAFPLEKLIYGGISSQFLGIVTPTTKSDNDNKPQNHNVFPF